jgi:nucleoside-diphosphate-sugar epimerase
MSNPVRVLVTGASGFIGQHLCSELAAAGLTVRAAVRKPCEAFLQCDQQIIGGIEYYKEYYKNWSAVTSKINVVVHLAARTHVLSRKAREDLAAFREVNVEGTRILAQVCVRAGIRRFVLLSTIKAVGEKTDSGECFSEVSPCRPCDPYGISKWEAEQVLREVAAGSATEVVILRAPLVYGPRVGANFLRLLRAIDRRTILPLASVHGRRSLLFVGNLASAVRSAIDHPAAADQVFHVADQESVSTKELVFRLGELLKKPARLLPVPVGLLRVAGAISGRSKDIQRLTGSLLVSTDKIQSRLGWSPPFSLSEGLARTVEWYRSLDHDDL